MSNIKAVQQGILWSKAFWMSWAERVLWTLGQIAIGLATAWAENDFSFENWDWKNTLFAISVSTVTAMLKGVGSNAITKTGPGSLNTEQVVPPVSAKAAAEQENPSLPNQPEI